MQNKIIKIRYIKSSKLTNTPSPLNPTGQGYTLIPHDTAPLRALGMNAQADILDSYPHFPHDAEFVSDVNKYVTHDFYFEFEYARCERSQTNINIWILVSGPNIDTVYHHMSEDCKDEYNFRRVLLEQLNDGLSELQLGRYLQVHPS